MDLDVLAVVVVNVRASVVVEALAVQGGDVLPVVVVDVLAVAVVELLAVVASAVRPL